MTPRYFPVGLPWEHCVGNTEIVTQAELQEVLTILIQLSDTGSSKTFRPTLKVCSHMSIHVTKKNCSLRARCLINGVSQLEVEVTFVSRGCRVVAYVFTILRFPC